MQICRLHRAFSVRRTRRWGRGNSAIVVALDLPASLARMFGDIMLGTIAIPRLVC